MELQHLLAPLARFGFITLVSVQSRRNKGKNLEQSQLLKFELLGGWVTYFTKSEHVFQYLWIVYLQWQSFIGICTDVFKGGRMSSEQNFQEGELRVFISSPAFTEKVNTIWSFYISSVSYMMPTCHTCLIWELSKPSDLRQKTHGEM